jgi:hypothetical protein
MLSTFRTPFRLESEVASCSDVDNNLTDGCHNASRVTLLCELHAFLGRKNPGIQAAESSQQGDACLGITTAVTEVSLALSQ